MRSQDAIWSYLYLKETKKIRSLSCRSNLEKEVSEQKESCEGKINISGEEGSGQATDIT